MDLSIHYESKLSCELKWETNPTVCINSVRKYNSKYIVK